MIFGLGAVDDTLQQRSVDAALTVGESCLDDGMGRRAGNERLDFLIADRHTEPVHFVLAQFVVDEPIEDALALEVHALRRHAFAGLLAVLLDLEVEGVIVLLGGDGIAIDDNHLAKGIGSDGVENTRVLKDP